MLATNAVWNSHYGPELQQQASLTSKGFAFLSLSEILVWGELKKIQEGKKTKQKTKQWKYCSAFMVRRLL